MKLRRLNDCLTDDERWEFHAEHYAWRIFRGLATELERTNPVDRDGVWYDAEMIRQKLTEMRANAPSRRPDDNERYRRAAAWRAGKLDEYDAIHWPERLAERNRQQMRQMISGTKPSKGQCPISAVLAEMGVTSEAAE